MLKIKTEIQNQRLKTGKILIVDDREGNRILLEALLTEYGYNVVSAINGKDALEKLHAEKGHNLIISDILMPVMDGFMLCKNVKKDEKLKNIPLIFYSTSYTDEKDEELALKLGVDRFIRKPIEPDELLKIVQGLLEDADNGKTKPQEIMLEDDRDTLGLYNERLVEKLQTKVMALENEIAERKRMENAFYKSEKKYRELAENMRELIYLADPTTFVATYINRAVEEVYGYTQKEWLSDNTLWEKTIHPDDYERVKSQCKDALEDGENVILEYRIVTKEGKTKLVEDRVLWQKDEKGNIIELSGILIDIKERKQYEEDLCIKNSYLRLLKVAAVAANEADDINDAFLPIMEEICRYTGWEIGHAYTISKNDPELLEPTHVWCLEDSKHFENFRSVSKKIRFTKGIGLPGRVLANSKPHWIVDVTKDKNFLRTKIAKALNLKSGIAFPVMVGTEVVAVLTFFTTKIVTPDQHFMDIMTDIGTQLGRATERKHAEEELRKSKETLDHAQEIAHLGSWEADIVKNKTLLSDEAYRQLGLIPQEYDGTYNSLLKSVHPGDKELVKKAVSESLYKRKPYNIEFRVVSKNGTERILHSEADVVFDDNGKPLKMIGTSLDITERKQVDKAIQTLVKSVVGKTGQECFNKIVFSMNEWLGTDCAFIGQITDGNNVKALSMLIDGKIIHDFGYTLNGELTPCGNVVESGFVIYSEGVCKLFPNDKVLLEMNAEGFVGTPLRNKDGKPIGLLWAVSRHKLNLPLRAVEVMDILAAKASSEIERKQMEGALVQSEKMKAMGIMTAGVAHEFNNILAVISTNAQMLEKTNRGDKELMKTLRTICRMADDGAKIVDRMYDFTNVHKDTSHYIRVDLNDLIKQVIDFTMPRWKEMAQAGGITYHIGFKGVKSLPPVLGNPSELREVLLNIVNNALDAMPGGGEITVKTRCVQSQKSRARRKEKIVSKLPARSTDGQTQNSLSVRQAGEFKSGFVEITFADTGNGMSDEVKKMMFDPFYTTRSPQGTGLGMSVSYGIITRHGGEINVESEIGKGSKINLSLPVAGKSIPHVITTRQSRKLKVDDLNVLVVDDQKEICESLSKLFIEEGSKVCSVNNGAEAIELLKKNNYDLLLCDLVMPEVNGKDVIKTVDTLNKRPKVGLITGWRYKMEHAKMDGLKVDFIVKKPFNFSKLRRDINSAFN